jgi:hypothetical protein
MNEQIVEKLKKILRLAGDKAATQGEIDSAMARAKEIAMQHDIDLSMIDPTDPNQKAKTFDVVKDQVAFSSTRERAYHYWISRVIKEVFGVYIVNVGLAYAFIGDKNDVAVAREVFIWLEDIYPASFRKKVTERQLAQCAAHRNGFYRGFTEGLLEVNRKAVKETLNAQKVDGGKYAMVLRNKETAIQQAVPTFFPKLRNVSHRRTGGDGGAQGMGHSEGRKINLNQMNGSSSRAALR